MGLERNGKLNAESKLREMFTCTFACLCACAHVSRLFRSNKRVCNWLPVGGGNPCGWNVCCGGGQEEVILTITRYQRHTLVAGKMLTDYRLASVFKFECVHAHTFSRFGLPAGDGRASKVKKGHLNSLISNPKDGSSLLLKFGGKKIK